MQRRGAESGAAASTAPLAQRCGVDEKGKDVLLGASRDACEDGDPRPGAMRVTMRGAGGTVSASVRSLARTGGMPRAGAGKNTHFCLIRGPGARWRKMPLDFRHNPPKSAFV